MPKLQGNNVFIYQIFSNLSLVFLWTYVQIWYRSTEAVDSSCGMMVPCVIDQSK